MYLCVFAVGLAMHFHWMALPQNMSSLSVLANWWVIGAAGIGVLLEFFADKIPWVDSLWDTIHTAIRPIGGALLSLAIVDPHDPSYQVAALLLGGTAALASHTAKASTRAAVNLSPEPVTNIALSSGEDVGTLGLLYASIAHPALAGGIAIAVLAFSIVVFFMIRRLMKKVTAFSGKLGEQLGQKLQPSDS